jgi:uncharacterized glyoxalase superfamily protein PhnB
MNQFECVVPILNVKDFAAAMDYYVSKLGFTKPWGTREMNVEDPDGHRIRMGSDATGPADKDGWERFSEMEQS